MNEARKNEMLRIAINLENDNAQKFLEIQRKLGIKNKTDVLRWLINWYHNNNIQGSKKR